MDRLEALLAALDPGRPVVVQTHDFPDLDAVASAWGLAVLLGRRGLSASCAYRGKIRSRSLASLVSTLGLSISNEAQDLPLHNCQLIVVDGSPVNGNVGLFGAELRAVIDHHRSEKDPLAPYVDIRPGMAACASIIEGYWVEARETLPKDVATALLTGIQSDTDFLSRSASPEDFTSYSRLIAQGDFPLASRIVRTVFDLEELGLVKEALSASVVKDGIFFAWVSGPCSQEVLAVLAEFVLRTEEIQAAVVAERGEGFCHGLEGAASACESGVHLSVRSKDRRWPAFDLVRSALEGCGSGGGHSHQAGGFIPDTTFPGKTELMERFFQAARHISS